MTLAAPDHQTSSQSANFIASIAAIEIPRDEWPELMTTLVESVQTGSKSLKLGSYKAIEYICETVVSTFKNLF
jgi:importin subunit beta-1